MVEQVTMAPNGPELSELVQGYWRYTDWNMSTQERLAFLQQHMELGITTVDHADVYGLYEAEQMFGEVLSIKPALREQLQIVTKCDIQLLTDKQPQRKIKHYDTSATHIQQSVENSLRLLGVDKLDVLLIHRPDVLMDADEVADVFHHLHQSGKVGAFGVSNFEPSQFSLLQSRLDLPLVTNQVEINPLNFDVAHDGTLDQLQQARVRPMAWSCLAQGELFANSYDARTRRVVNALTSVGEEIGADNISQVIYAWIRRLPSKPLPVLGSGKIERVKNAVDSLSLEMTREQWYEIWTASMGQEVP
ncbi:aldo/keto reductase [Vibrio palustris]|uniref:Oxidoreductase YdhF n=1 Tax=Vibrio palustris TaxID=1918946 RepID=A0A1R4B577_9VIBR|nr:aldo/keto reductase family oxidoreductase [Vibrio palustris]SJL84074.1 Oxidoreductase YdhF [Vibrio palustris]